MLLADEIKARYIAIAEGIVVTLILGSTLPVVKMALDYLGPLTITSLRYSLAFLLLFPFVARRGGVRRWPSYLWIRLLGLGLGFYVIGNGALYLGLKYIPATTGSLLLSLVPLLVLFAGILWLEEVPTRLQIAGVVIALAGSLLFFSPGFKGGEPLGVAIVAIGLAGSASLSILGRGVAREEQVDTLSLTAIPLAIGGGILLPIALLAEGVPRFSGKAWGIIVVLAVVNTVSVYVLYNHALRILAAFEMSIIANLTPLVTAVWAWFLLGERLDVIQTIGIVTVISGVALVQWGRQNPKMV